MKRSNNNDIDRLFQSHFDWHDTPVKDKDALWNRIQPRRNRRLIPVLVLMGFVTAMGFSYSFLIMDDDMSAVEDSLLSNLEEESQSLNRTATNGLSAKLDRLVESQKDVLPFLKNSSESLLNPKSPITELKTPNTKSNAQKKDTGLKSINPRKLLTSEPIINSTDQTLITAKGNIQNNLIKATAQAHSIEDNMGAQVTGIEVSNRLISRNSKIEILSLPTSKTDYSTLYSIASSAKPGVFRKDKNPLNDCKPGHAGHPYLDIYSILGSPMVQTELIAGFEDQLGYITDWNGRYADLPSISLGLMLGYEFVNGIDIAIGAEYQKMQSQYKTTQTIIETVTVYDPMAYFFYDDNNEVVWVGDSVTASSTYDRTIAVANMHNLVHIPLQVSYPLIRKGPWNIKASAAAILNLSFQYRGQLLRPDNSLVEINDVNQSNYFSPNIGVSLELGGHVGYNLSSNWEAYISPRFRYNQQSYLSDTQILSLNRNFVNLRMGIQYHF